MTPVFQWVYAPPQQQRADRIPTQRADAPGISDRIAQAFDAASENTGTSFEYLVKTAQRESAMKPDAKAATSSAAGLFQFIESTWLETMKQAGPGLGLGAVADKIVAGADGRYRVPDASDREEILAMRFDPEVASMMAGALTRKNAAYLSDKLGREPNAGELYIAHFLGARGASDFIRLAESNPDAIAADHFPKQARANKPIFYEGGKGLSAAAVYADLVGRHGGTGTVVSPDVMVADTGTTSPVLAYAGDNPADRVAAGWRAAAPTDAFSALFRNDQTQAATAPVAAAAFWKGYTTTPGLFQVAMEEDARLLAAAPRLPKPVESNPSLAARVTGWRSNDGPLDLGQFLQIDES